MPAGHLARPSALFAPAVAVADAVLYEGYLLYPYRRSSAKNKVRWQFGVLLPREWAGEHGLDDTGVAGSAESWWQQTECLVAAAAQDIVHVRVRFLQVQRRTVEQRAADGSWRAAERVAVGGHAVTAFEEAVPREADISASLGDLLRAASVTGIGAPAGRDVEVLAGPGAGEAGRLVRRRAAVSATVGLSARPCGPANRLLRLRIRVENAAGGLDRGADRTVALDRALIATHTLIAVPDGAFVSLLEPPEWARDAARGCRNVHTFPVLAGADGGASVVLSSPIILYDRPQVAPESPGDLHDAAEIDEILSLRTLTLTEQEKAEARATDPHAAAIVDRVEVMPPEVFGRLHGAIRSLKPVTGEGAGPAAAGRPGGQPATAGPGPGEDGPRPGEDGPRPGEDGNVVVAGVRLRKGSRVRLRPRAHGTDAHDMFLAGRTARVERVLADLDGSCHLAVTLEDDPAAELNVWYGRFRYFRPDEVEPLDGAAGNTAGNPGRSRARSTRGQEGSMDAIELLEHDHRMVEQLFRDYPAAASDRQRRGVAEILIRELSKHAALEELTVYPFARRYLPAGTVDVDEHLAEHMAVKKTLAALDSLPAGDSGERALVDELQREVERHVAEEERQFFPALRGAVDETALKELGEQLDKAKRLAPTRPHPHAPDKPPAEAVIGAIAAIYDRFRDRLQGRPQT